MRIFWPDFSSYLLRSKKVIRIATRVKRSIEPIVRQHELREIPTLSDDYSMAAFFHDLEKWEIRYREYPVNETIEAHKKLAEIEKDFGTLANIFSLAFKPNYNGMPRFLFLGDLEGDILSGIWIPNSKCYDFIKASHHGTEFGSSLENISTNFLLMSRVENSPKLGRINRNYIERIRYKMFFSTSFVGDCFFV